jgi:hypothetical protein
MPITPERRARKRQHKQDERKKRLAEGQRQVNVWLPQRAFTLLNILARIKGSQSDAITEGLDLAMEKHQCRDRAAPDEEKEGKGLDVEAN